MFQASLIISFYKNLSALNSILAALELQDEKAFEVIIADDGSPDEIIAELGKIINTSPLAMQHVWHEDNGFRKTIILNEAIRKSRADYLIFIDGDCIPHHCFVGEHIKERLPATVLAGRRANLSPGLAAMMQAQRIRNGYLESFQFKSRLWLDGIFGKGSHTERGMYFKNRMLRRFFNRKDAGILGCNFSLWKEDFLQINGFDERYLAPAVGEDTDVEARLRWNNSKVKTVKNMPCSFTFTTVCKCVHPSIKKSINLFYKPRLHLPLLELLKNRSLGSIMNNVFGAILPHTKIYGGVKRFLELGNIFTEMGITFIVFTPDAHPPDWFNYKGKMELIQHIPKYLIDVLFLTEIEYLEELKKSDALLKVYYCVLQYKGLRKVIKEPEVELFVNSKNLFEYVNKKFGVNPFIASGGIDCDKFAFKPKKTKDDGNFTIMAYGRFYISRKGTMKVVRACERLYKQGYKIHLLLFDTPTNEKARQKVMNFTCKVPHSFFVDYPVAQLPDLYYKADVFVAAEKRAGWSNTSAEAMACGLPVIGTSSGARDFLINDKTGLVIWRHSFFIRRALKRLMKDAPLRKKLAENGRNKIEGFSWKSLASKIYGHVSESLNKKSD